MTDLSAEQTELKSSITKSATTWGIILGLIVAVILYFVLGSQGMAIRAGAAVVVGALAGYGIFRWQFGSQSKAAQCGNCGAAFSISRTDHQETLSGSEDKVEREAQDDGSTKVTRFTEESYDVVDTYTCSSCGDATTKEYKITRRTNEESKVDPAPAPTPESAPASAVSGAKASSSSGGDDAPPPKSPPSGGLGRGGSGSV